MLLTVSDNDNVCICCFSHPDPQSKCQHRFSPVNCDVSCNGTKFIEFNKKKKKKNAVRPLTCRRSYFVTKSDAIYCFCCHVLFCLHFPYVNSVLCFWSTSRKQMEREECRDVFSQLMMKKPLKTTRISHPTDSRSEKWKLWTEENSQASVCGQTWISASCMIHFCSPCVTPECCWEMCLERSTLLFYQSLTLTVYASDSWKMSTVPNIYKHFRWKQKGKHSRK